MKKQYAVLLRYHEIALKGANRGWFETKLTENARKIVQQFAGPEIPVKAQRGQGRIILHTEWNDTVRSALKHVFGLSSFSPMRVVETDKEKIRVALMEEFEQFAEARGIPASFAVRTRRSAKVFGETSMELDRFFGSSLLQKHPDMKVDLTQSELTLGIECHLEKTYIWLEKIPGPGGLPAGTNGHVLTLLSGGIDSPVASIMALKRGLSTSFIHFYGTPFVGEEVLNKVDDLARKVNLFQAESKPLYVVPFGKIQEKIALVTNPKVRTLLYRRLMVRIANRLAEKIKAKSLITGESLGQVASQTMENMAAIEAVSEIPILRPLITFDKEEIIARAKDWDTYETAIRPGVDCCTLFADRHPTIRANLDVLREQEEKYSVEALIEEAAAGVKIHRF